MGAGYVETDKHLQRVLNLFEGATYDFTAYNLHLFTDAITVTDAIQATSVLTEPTWTGYAPSAQDLTTWAPAAVAAHLASITAPAASDFTNGSAPSVDIYGYYVTDDDDEIAWAESFTAPQTVDFLGTISITPALKQKTCR